jgi:hypothetical protein
LQISQQSQLYGSVNQAYEQAKIEEVRDAPGQERRRVRRLCLTSGGRLSAT